MSSRTAQYKGRTYRLEYLGATKFGRRAKLKFMDGSKEFWVEAGLVTEGRADAGASRLGSYATIGQRTQARMDRTGWTGCSCGSIEGHPRPSDCFSCRHDSE